MERRIKMEKKFKVGYTTGVFDMLHVGHLNILRRAKEQCEYLIVGVSTDELVLQYKNIAPIIPFEERLEMVEALECVDEVVAQINRDKFSAWKNLKFDAMFVGDDWKGNSLFVEVEKKLNEHGVEVVYFPYTKNTSSTILREKLKVI